MDIKPIETIYNGYRFRSRLEARWAVFFSEANINYEYETEGFDLNGEWYLPDFWLPDFKVFVEIKPFDNSVVKYVGDGNIWEEKCRTFRDLTGKAILICYGDPAESLYKLLFAYDLCDSNGGSSEYNTMFVTYNKHTVLVTEPTRNDREIYLYKNYVEQSPYVGTPYQIAGDHDLLWERAAQTIDFDFPTDDITTLAKIKARQARFEHNAISA